MTREKTNKTIGGRIHNLRTGNNDSIAGLAEYLGVTMKVIYNIESDLSEPSLAQLALIKKKYRTSYDYLIEGNNAK